MCTPTLTWVDTFPALTTHLRILGIDPGLRITGYGCVDHAVDSPNADTIVEAGVIRLGRSSQPSTTPESLRDARTMSSRLLELEHDLSDILSRLNPNVVAVESVFAHFKHPATAIIMGHARGVILLCVRRAGLELCELRPNAIKKFLTGYGHASKQQMQFAIRDHFRLAEPPKPADVADAIAIALCAGTRRQLGPLIPSAAPPARSRFRSRSLAGLPPQAQAQIRDQIRDQAAAELAADIIGTPSAPTSLP
jgi:crossover junction endodeoxyribonuclease RuvC